MSSTVLERILASTREEVARRKRELPLQELLGHGGLAGEPRGPDAPAGDRPARHLASDPGRFHEAIAGPGIAVIAEFKRRSPSAGPLRASPDVREIVDAYVRGGAAALSILTEGPNFEGSLDDLRAARAACGLPILRKDFILDPYQLHEARLAGADAVLLIVAALEQPTLESLHREARALGLDVLVEVHDRAELHRALALGADLIGINNRDLRDFSVDVARTSRLLGEIPPGVAVVSESGIAAPAQLRELEAQGVHAVLVGETLMRAPNPTAALRELRG
ncbi:MAG TPA: indole-3-glycerol phosphate synthase TrpC [Solirubrobacteraceae bacterium]|nr:indole-3-glycerol phosphate synthase TrpC [Solirubrobacteraceae bacterium]